MSTNKKETLSKLKQSLDQSLIELQKLHKEVMLHTIADDIRDYLDLLDYYDYIESEIRGMKHELFSKVSLANLNLIIKRENFDQHVEDHE
jgi:hypothetical protein